MQECRMIFSYRIPCVLNSRSYGTIRLRAAVFINACAIRDAVTLRQGPILTPSNMQKLETANYLFHSALNCVLIFKHFKQVFTRCSTKRADFMHSAS